MIKNRLITVSLIAMMVVSAARADIASTKYVDDALTPIGTRLTTVESDISQKQDTLTTGEDGNLQGAGNVTVSKTGDTITITGNEKLYEFDDAMKAKIVNGEELPTDGALTVQGSVAGTLWAMDNIPTGTSQKAGVTKLYSYEDIMAMDVDSVDDLPTDGTVTVKGLFKGIDEGYLAKDDFNLVMEEAEKQMTQLGNNVASLQTGVGALQNDVDTLETDVGELKDNLGEPNGNNSYGFAYSSDIPDVSGFAAQSEVDLLKDNLGEPNGNNSYGFAYSSEIPDISSLQNDVGQLQTSFESKQNLLDDKNVKIEGTGNVVTGISASDGVVTATLGDVLPVPTGTSSGGKLVLTYDPDNNAYAWEPIDRDYAANE